MASPYGNYPSPGYQGFSNQYSPNAYNPYSPVYQSPYANTLTRYESQYPQYGQTVQPPVQQQQPTAQPVNAMVVTSIDEAKAQPADLTGAKQIFIDTSNGKMYTKQFNVQTGGSDFAIYEKEKQPDQETMAAQQEPQPEEAQPQNNYATKDDLQEFNCKMSSIEDMIKKLEARLDVQPNGISTIDGEPKSTNKSSNTTSSANATDGPKPKRNTAKPNAEISTA